VDTVNKTREATTTRETNMVDIREETNTTRVTTTRTTTCTRIEINIRTRDMDTTTSMVTTKRRTSTEDINNTMRSK